MVRTPAGRVLDAGGNDSRNVTSPQASTPAREGSTSTTMVRPAIRPRKLAREAPSALIRWRTVAAVVPVLVARIRSEPLGVAGSFGLTGVVTRTPPLVEVREPTEAILATVQ